MKFYSYDEFAKDVRILAKDIKNKFEPEVIVAIARGGMTLGHCLAVALNNRKLFSLNSIHYDGEKKLNTVEISNIPDLSKYKKILLTDDIIDSGESLVAIKKRLLELYPQLDIKIVSIFYKPKALLIPEFCVREADDWIDFFWDVKI
ncbi:MAG: phosphoribosyltransferase [Campylobacter sp.]|nr:phosphoribosyltransferase [Campylobacter sp.]